LLQQFLSFNSNTGINTNPYIFTYAKNNTKTGGGFAMGTGMSYNSNSSDDGISIVNTENANFTIRLGYEKKYLQHEKFIPFWGIEFGAGYVYNQTSSTLLQTFTSNRTVVQTSRVFAGPSFRAGLNYALSRHVLLGTEFFFNAQISYTETRTTGLGISDSFKPFNIGFQVPTALFLVYRF